MKREIGYTGLVAAFLWLAVFYISYEFDFFSDSVRRNLNFYLVCAAFSGILFYASNDRDDTGILYKLGSIVFLFILVVYAIMDIFKPDLTYRWVYIPLGGLLICLVYALYRKFKRRV